MDKFSVSMCVYQKDNPEHFRIAVNSILDQSIKPDEVVLVCDGPLTEELDEIVNGFESETFKVIRLETNQGHGVARRTSCAACTNDLIALMDADDISVHERFEKQLKAFEQHTEASVIGGQITEFIDDIKNVKGKRIVPVNDEDIKNEMRTRCPMNQVTVMFRKQDVDEVGGYMDWFCEEDYYLWLRLMLADKKFFNVDENLVYVRVGKEMYQRRGGMEYFTSEAKFQKLMLDKKVINHREYAVNVLKRFIVQVLLPNKLRSFVFQKFARQ